MKIIQYTQESKSKIISYIGDKYYKCLYLYLDLCQYGIDDKNVKVWVQEDDLNNITAVCLKYHTALHLYSKENDFEVVTLVDLIKDETPSIICAEVFLINALAPFLAELNYQSEFGHIGMYQNSSEHNNINFDDICAATNRDIDDIAKLLYEDEDIGASYTLCDLKQQIRERLISGFTRSYVVKKDGELIAHVGSGAETNNVCTLSYLIVAPSYRQMGYAKHAVQYFCRELSKEGKEIYSVYYPESSRKLHHKIGFIDVCNFGKLYIRKH